MHLSEETWQITCIHVHMSCVCVCVCVYGIYTVHVHVSVKDVLSHEVTCPHDKSPCVTGPLVTE